MAALFFLGFAYFAVGQATVSRNGSQTAADAAALAAAREMRDEVKDAFLTALEAGDVDKLQALLRGDGMRGVGACAAAADYANLNHARTQSPCLRVDDPPGYSVTVVNQDSVGESVIKGTESKYAVAHATAVVDAQCTVVGPEGDAIRFSCKGRSDDVRVDPAKADFQLDLSMFYSVHLTS